MSLDVWFHTLGFLILVSCAWFPEQVSCVLCPEFGWFPKVGFLRLVAWAWFPEFGSMWFVACVWFSKFGFLSLVSWLWFPGLVYWGWFPEIGFLRLVSCVWFPELILQHEGLCMHVRWASQRYSSVTVSLWLAGRYRVCFWCICGLYLWVLC